MIFQDRSFLSNCPTVGEGGGVEMSMRGTYKFGTSGSFNGTLQQQQQQTTVFGATSGSDEAVMRAKEKGGSDAQRYYYYYIMVDSS